MTWRVFFISSEPPSLGFVKVNIDGNVRDGKDGAGFIVCGLNARLLAVGGSYLFKPSVQE